MKNFKRKIVTGVAASLCAVLAMELYTILEESSSVSLPVSVEYEEEKPVIVLDAGHGESTKTYCSPN